MQNLVIAGVQAQQYWEDKAKNLLHFEQMLSVSDLSDVDVLVFPEMFHTGFTMKTDALADRMNDSIGITWLSGIAKQFDCLTLASLIVSEDENVFNRMVAVFPDGTLTYYDKRHLFSLAGEDMVFTPGDRDVIIEFKGWKIKPQVCFDLRFPEAARNGIGEDGQRLYDLLVYTANWPTRRIEHWDILIPARAVENQCYVLAVNRVGVDGNGIAYNGHSQLVDGWGNRILIEEDRELIMKSTLKKEDLKNIHDRIPFLKDKK
jgi:predicted amidohydrolase